MSVYEWEGQDDRRVFNFDVDLARSQRQACDPMWREVYAQAFPRFQSMEYVIDIDGQRSGTDRLVTLAGGSVVRIEEKTDYTAYYNIFIEMWSDAERGVPGWIGRPLECDYIAYAFIERRQCYLLPYHALRRAYFLNARQWIKDYKIRDIPNVCNGRRWTTKGIPVRIDRLRHDMNRALVVEWTGDPQAGDMTIVDDDEDADV